MSNVLLRVKKRVSMTCEEWENDAKFSIKLATYRVLDELGGRIHLSRTSMWANKKKDEWIIAYLEKLLVPIIDKYKAEKPNKPISLKEPIWVCWWTGMETAPEIVKKCIQSIYQNAGQHPINVITERNYRDYLEIPDEIVWMVEKRAICLANFSDYLRVSLLERYGGLWLDATIFLSEKINESYFTYPFFTCKRSAVDCKYVSKYRWTSFCMGGFAKNPFFTYMRESLERCWLTDHASIDYLLVDYLIEVAYRNFSWFREMFNELPCNNEHRDDLQAAFNAALPASEFKKVIQTDTQIYKLSWREKYLLEVNGERTIYGFFIEDKWST